MNRLLHLNLLAPKLRSISLRAVIVPVLVSLALLWVFARPLTALSLFIYKFTGSFISTGYQNIQTSRQQAADLVSTRELAAQLELENRTLKVINTAVEAAALKTRDYQAALDFKSNFNYKTIFAQVIGRSPDSWHKQIIISKGSDDGVLIGRGVLTEQGIIGQVSKTSPHSAIVQLIFNPDWRMGVKIARLGQYGVLNGNYPGPASLQFITVDSQVQVGDEIVTSGVCIDTGNCPYPENFPVGKVVEVRRDPNQVDLVVKVEFYEDLSGIREVFVLDYKTEVQS